MFMTQGSRAGRKRADGALFSIKDNLFCLVDDLDPTKKAQFQCSGIASGATRTYGLPDASATLLYNGGPLGTPASGILSNCTSATLAADTNTTALATTAFVLGQAGSNTPIINGVGTVGTSLRYSREDHIHPVDTSRLAVSASANPSATLGLAVVNGSASTYMRSDAAPALSQSITPTWTGSHAFQSTVLIGTTNVNQFGTLAVRSTAGATIEFGHSNTAGYGSEIGANLGDGTPYLAFNASRGTTSNTFKTLGLKGAVFRSDLAGGFQWGSITNTSADNQSFTQLMSLSTGGTLNASAVQSAGNAVMTVAGNQTLTGGFFVTPSNQGTFSTGTFTPTASAGNYQFYTNNGAHTLAAPSADSAIDILVTNGASAGTITFSGFTIASGNVGDALTTTNTSKFIISVRRINSISTYTVKALQ